MAKAAQLFNPEAPREGNNGYLSALVDGAYIPIRCSKRDGRALRVRISMGRSRPEAKRMFAFINKYYEVEGTIKPVNLKHTPSVIRRAEIGEPAEYNTAFYYSITDPSDVLKIAKAAITFSEDRPQLKELIAACEEILEREGGA